MENRIERAAALHKAGYNCAQAVFCAYCGAFGMDERTAFKVAEGFGGGIGGMRDGTCGAASAVYMLAGLKNSGGSVEDGVTKKETYDKVRELAEIFREENGANICRELISLRKEGKGGSCDDLIASAARIVERELLGGAE